MFNYVASGRLLFRSLPAPYKVLQAIILKFQERDIAYEKKKAELGYLRAIAVKRIILNSGIWSGGQIVPIYVDTWNGYWNEYDLLTHAEALALATAYWQKLSIEAAALLELLATPP